MRDRVSSSDFWAWGLAVATAVIVVTYLAQHWTLLTVPARGLLKVFFG